MESLGVPEFLVGLAIGLVMSLLFWSGNQAPNLISTFPDGIAILALAVLVAAAVRFDLHQSQSSDRRSALKSGVTIGAATGLVFGSAVVLLVALRFSLPAIGLSAFGFVTAFASALICGVLSALPRSGRTAARAA